ncbi:MAG TPA: hypothetical protein VKZ61_18305 [Thermomicrobiales bacterium]|jgi:hypothetical protein|nr:hypothetical protein [Thermomicrobiales bacterium]
MTTTSVPGISKIDEDVCKLVARHIEAHHRRAERLHYAETGSTGPIDEEQEAFDEISRLIRMAQPELDGDEQAAIERLRAALIEAEHRTEG